MKFLPILLLLASSAFAATPSPNDSVIVAPSSSLITDAAGNTWGITSAGLVSKNGAADKTTGAVIELAYVNAVLWQENTSKMWYSWTGTTWSAGTSNSPLPVGIPSQATLSWSAPTTDTNGAPITVPLTYNVYKGTAATSMTKWQNVSGLTVQDSAGSTSPTTYFYAVTAVQAGQEGAQSNVVSGTIAAPVLTPAAPGTVTITTK